MTTTDTTVNNLIINTMTQAQYNQITPSNNELYLVTDSTITSSEVTSALGYTPTTPANVDGQFVQSTLELSTNKNVNSYDFYLGTTAPTGKNALSYLPTSDKYIVYGQIVSNGNTSSQHWVGTVANPATETACFRALSRTASSSVLGINYFAFPIVPDGNGYQAIYEQITNNNIATSANITLMGYRRIGTNS